MSRDSTPATRRRVLRLSGATLAGLAATGAASADHFHPDVTTDDATDVTSYEATLNGTLTDMGNADSVDVWFEWGEQLSGMPNKTTEQTLSSTGSFDQYISPLDSDTGYVFAAYARANDATESGDTVSFWTDEGISPE